MEKKYLTGTAKLPMMGNTQIAFDDVKNFIETKNENGEVSHFEFDDKDGHYSFTKIGNVYVEDNDRAPDLFEYKTMCRRTALKHAVVGDEANRTEVIPNKWKEADRGAHFEQTVDNALRNFGFFGGENE